MIYQAMDAYVAVPIDIEYYSVAYFERITKFDAELPLRVGLIRGRVNI